MNTDDFLSQHTGIPAKVVRRLRSGGGGGAGPREGSQGRVGASERAGPAGLPAVSSSSNPLDDFMRTRARFPNEVEDNCNHVRDIVPFVIPVIDELRMAVQGRRHKR